MTVTWQEPSEELNVTDPCGGSCTLPGQATTVWAAAGHQPAPKIVMDIAKTREQSRAERARRRGLSTGSSLFSRSRRKSISSRMNPSRLTMLRLVVTILLLGLVACGCAHTPSATPATVSASPVPDTPELAWANAEPVTPSVPHAVADAFAGSFVQHAIRGSRPFFTVADYLSWLAHRPDMVSDRVTTDAAGADAKAITVTLTRRGGATTQAACAEDGLNRFMTTGSLWDSCPALAGLWTAGAPTSF